MINYNVDSDGIATITWDMPNRSMNVLNEASMTAYAGALETAMKDAKVKGIIITSAKDSFIAGADLEMILSLDTSDASKLMEQFSTLQKLFRSQETGGKPVVAAINGTALGGGFEMCLASHYRIAAANPKTKIGQPEVKIGLLPGGGGTQRIPRLIGASRVIEMMLTGRQLSAARAEELGLAHYLVDDGAGLAKAMELARLIVRNAPATNYAIVNGISRISEMPPGEGLFAQARKAGLDIEALGERMATRKQELMAEFKDGADLPPPETRSFTGHELVQGEPVEATA